MFTISRAETRPLRSGSRRADTVTIWLFQIPAGTLGASFSIVSVLADFRLARAFARISVPKRRIRHELAYEELVGFEEIHHFEQFRYWFDCLSKARPPDDAGFSA
jgi:hypothetical protein